jgi:hypothetical protein
MHSRQMPCPSCSHEHLWLDCDWCECTSHIQTGIYEGS